MFQMKRISHLCLLSILHPNGNLDVLLCLNRGTPKRCLDLSNLSSGEMSATQFTTSADLDETGREKGEVKALREGIIVRGEEWVVE